MFHIYLDEKYPLHIPDMKQNNKLISAVLEQELNKAGQFNFKLPCIHKYYDSLHNLKSRIDIYDDNDLIFKGRVLKQGHDFQKNKTVTAEGEFAYFNDSVFQPSVITEYTVEHLISSVIEIHNSQVDTSRQFQVGNIDVNYVTVPDLNFYKTIDFLLNVIVKNAGGYFLIRYENDTRYLDYRTTPLEYSPVKIEYGVNLLDLNKYIDATEVYTCIVPYGNVNEVTGKPLDISGVNGGEIWVENTAAVQQFGRIYKPVEFKGITDAEDLFAMAIKYSDSVVAQAITLELTALEMRRIDFRNPEKIFTLGNCHRLISAPHGINEFFLCSKKKTDLFVPENNKVQLGYTRKSLTDYI